MTNKEKQLKAMAAMLVAEIQSKSNGELLKSVGAAALPDKKETVVGIAATVILGVTFADPTSGAVMNALKVAGSAVGAALVYAGVRSAVVGNKEWAELIMRGVHGFKKCPKAGCAGRLNSQGKCVLCDTLNVA